MGRLVFTSGEILTAANMNELSDQSVMVFADSTARSSAIPSPTEGMVTYLEDSDELEVYTTAWGGVSTPGILQVKQTVLTTASATTTSAEFLDIAGLDTTFTCSSTDSKVLIFVSVSGELPGGVISFAPTADGSVITSAVASSTGNRVAATSANSTNTLASFTSTGTFLHSPASVAEITYGVRVLERTSGSQSDTWYINRSSNDSDNGDRLRAVSSITLLEVAG